MGLNLARGTVISIALVMFVLPQLLLIGAKLIDRTSFSVEKVARDLNLITIPNEEEVQKSDEE